jgi:CHASE3 domain sensor protein
MLRKLNLTAKLGLGFGSLLCLLLLLGLSSYYYTLQMVEASHSVRHRVEERSLLTQLESDMREQSLAVHDFVLVGADEALQRDEKSQRALAADMDALERTIITKENKDRSHWLRICHKSITCPVFGISANAAESFSGKMPATRGNRVLN